MSDPEIEAMGVIARAMEALPPGARGRVAAEITARFDLDGLADESDAELPVVDAVEAAPPLDGPPEADSPIEGSLEAAITAARATVGWERVLVVAYRQEGRDFRARDVSKALQLGGYPHGDIPRLLAHLAHGGHLERVEAARGDRIYALGPAGVEWCTSRLCGGRGGRPPPSS